VMHLFCWQNSNLFFVELKVINNIKLNTITFM
jgi:hypothetical protein